MSPREYPSGDLRRTDLLLAQADFEHEAKLRGYVSPAEFNGAIAEASAAKRERDVLRAERAECVLTVHAQRMIEAEREACAKVADEVERVCPGYGASIAAAIRARGGR